MIVDCAVYRDGAREGGLLTVDEAYSACRGGSGFAWIGLYEPTEAEFDDVRRRFALHELAVEDMVQAHQRPKLEVYGESLFVVLKTAVYREETATVEFGEIQMFIGKDFLIAVRHGGTDLREARRGIEARPDLLVQGPAAVLYAIIDRVVDGYQPVLDGVDSDIREVEEQVFSDEAENPAERIYRLKREVLALHDSMNRLPESIDRLARGSFVLVAPEMRPYFRDIEDHLLKMVAEIESFRELLTSVLTANLTQVTVRQNEDMRRISAWAAMVTVPTLIAGIYGMNFESMPELSWQYGYPLVLGSIAGAVVAIYLYFHKIGWI